MPNRTHEEVLAEIFAEDPELAAKYREWREETEPYRRVIEDLERRLTAAELEARRAYHRQAKSAKRWLHMRAHLEACQNQLRNLEPKNRELSSVIDRVKRDRDELRDQVKYLRRYEIVANTRTNRALDMLREAGIPEENIQAAMEARPADEILDVYFAGEEN